MGGGGLRRHSAPRSAYQAIPRRAFGLVLRRVHATQCIEDKNEQDEAEEHDIKLPEPGEDTAESLQLPEQYLNIIAPLVHFLVIFPRINPVPAWGNHGLEPQIQCRLAGPVAFICPVHQ